MFLSFYCLIIVIFAKIFLSRIFQIKQFWFILTISIYAFSFICLSYFFYKELDLIQNLLTATTIISSYILFLTLVFNDSPTLFLIYLRKKKKKKESFLKKKFVSDRISLLIKSNMIDHNFNLKKKGRFILSLSKNLSDLFLK